jgi:branched-chain amino acid transport system substrate-binding protein
VHTLILRAAIFVSVVSLFLYACTSTVQEPTLVPSMNAVTVEVPVPVTVEVTRIVPERIIVEAIPTPQPACASSTFEEAEEIVIGAVIPLSTSGDILGGFAMQTALSIAISEVNDAGGIRDRPVRLITYDSGGYEDQAAAAVQRLARDDCAVAIAGFLHDNAAVSASNRANALDIPLVIAGATTDEVPLQQHPQVFRIAPSDTMLAEMPAIWLAEVGDYNNDGSLFVVSIVDSRKHDSAAMTRLETKFEEYGIAFDTLPVDLPASDFSSVIARIVSMDRHPDAVFIFVDGDAALELEQQLRAKGIGPHKNTLIVNNETALDSDRFWQIVPDGLGTIVSRVGPWHKTVTPSGQTFALKYANYFGHWPEYQAFAAYDAVLLLADALERSATPGSADLTQALTETDAMLASGHYFFPYTSPRSGDSASTSDHMWNQWPEVHTLYLQYDEPGQSSSDMPIIWPDRYRSTDGPLSWTRPETP